MRRLSSLRTKQTQSRNVLTRNGIRVAFFSFVNVLIRLGTCTQPTSKSCSMIVGPLSRLTSSQLPEKSNLPETASMGVFSLLTRRPVWGRYNDIGIVFLTSVLSLGRRVPTWTSSPFRDTECRLGNTVGNTAEEATVKF